MTMKEMVGAVGSMVLALTPMLLMTSAGAKDVSQLLWRHAFSSDVVAGCHELVLSKASRAMCAYRCKATSNCQSFAHHDESGTCWLYNYIVEYVRTGAISPGTRFYWPVHADCPLPYTLTSGVCYWVGHGKTWLQAKNRCQEDGGHLFMANTLVKLGLLQALPTGYYSLGGEDYNDEGTWRWLNGEPITGGWGPFEPSANTADCDCLFFIENRAFDDCRCSNIGSFVCEIPYKNS